MAPPLFRLKLHDRYHVEVKCAYPLNPQRRRETVKFEAYLFLPISLNLNSETYSKEQFYQDLNTYTRFGTPSLSWAELLDTVNPLAPFARLEQIKAQAAQRSFDGPLAEQTTYEARVLACIFRANTRDARNAILKELHQDEPTPAALDAALARTEALLADAGRTLARLRALRQELLALRPPAPAAQGLAWVDEAVSIHWENVCAQLHRAVAPVEPRAGALAPGVRGALTKLAAAMQQEEQYRRESGYPAVLDTGSGPEAQRAREHFLYRGGMLKKYVQSVLYLTVRHQPGSRSLLTLLYALAAMGAMAAFVLLLWLMNGVTPVNSLPYLLLMVVSYAFKDRLKDALKAYFSAHMTGLLRDRETQLVDRGPSKAVLGRAAEACAFVARGHVPAEVLAARPRHELTEWAEEGQFENVLMYQKSLALYVDRIFWHHRRVRALDEIARLSIRRFLHDTDEPSRPLWTPADGSALHRLPGGRAYYVDMVLRILMPEAPGGAKAELAAFRLVLSRDGLLRVEALDTAQGPPRVLSLRDADDEG